MNIQKTIDNTITTASDSNYAWGVFFLAASMRFSGMKEPLLVLAKNYTNRQIEAIMQFEDVRIIDASSFDRSMTCAKPKIMLSAETQYSTWVDCDGFFYGNCSSLLKPEARDEIHIRSRSIAEMASMKFLGDSSGLVKKDILDKWQLDIGERTNPNFSSLVVANYISVHRDSFYFIEHWDAQMKKALPSGDFGVVDAAQDAYRMTDESVLNSLLYFAQNRPNVSKDFRLAMLAFNRYLHFPLAPKPWRDWTKYTLRYYDRYMAVVDEVLKRKMALPADLPFPLRRGNKNLCVLKSHLLPITNVSGRIFKKFKDTLRSKKTGA